MAAQSWGLLPNTPLAGRGEPAAAAGLGHWAVAAAAAFGGRDGQTCAVCWPLASSPGGHCVPLWQGGDRRVAGGWQGAQRQLRAGRRN